jgi:hypothetical protein
MGLDMYLSKKTYVKYWEHNGDNNYDVKVTKAGNPTNINPKKVSYIVEEVGYWRKANAIHQWFVDNCQGGVDDCRDAYVSRENLEQLLNLCKIVSIDNDKAEQLLPTASGFFFGGTGYDEWYYEGINSTIEILEEALSDGDADEFSYHSSW